MSIFVVNLCFPRRASSLFPVCTFQGVSSNECVVLTHLTDSVLKHKGLSWNFSSVIVQFLVNHVSSLFEIPEGLKEKVDARIRETKVGKVPVVEGRLFCYQTFVNVR